MTRKIAFIGLAAICSLLCLPAHADEKYAMELYKYGNYIDASIEFKKLVDANPNDLKLIYYYADSLLRRGKRKEALAEYWKIYKTSPKSQYGKYSLQVLKTYKVVNVTPTAVPTKTGTAPATAPAVTKAPGRSSAPGNIIEFKNGKPVGTTGSAARSDVDNSQQQDTSQQDKEIISKLPRITKQPAETPTLQEISAWPLFNQAGYYAAANERLERAKERVRQAETLKSDAYRVAYSAVGSQRRFGETEEQTRTRVEASKDRTDKILGPYDENIKYYSDIVNNEQSIVNLCDRARNAYVPFPGTYYPPGWR